MIKDLKKKIEELENEVNEEEHWRDIEDAILDLATRDEGMSIFILKLILINY